MHWPSGGYLFIKLSKQWILGTGGPLGPPVLAGPTAGILVYRLVIWLQYDTTGPKGGSRPPGSVYCASWNMTIHCLSAKAEVSARILQTTEMHARLWLLR